MEWRIPQIRHIKMLPASAAAQFNLNDSSVKNKIMKHFNYMQSLMWLCLLALEVGQVDESSI